METSSIGMSEKVEYLIVALDKYLQSGYGTMAAVDKALGSYKNVFHPDKRGRTCCFISPETGSCGARADWEIYKWDGTPDEWTYSCGRHLAAMMWRDSRARFISVSDE